MISLYGPPINKPVTPTLNTWAHRPSSDMGPWARGGAWLLFSAPRGVGPCRLGGKVCIGNDSLMVCARLSSQLDGQGMWRQTRWLVAVIGIGSRIYRKLPMRHDRLSIDLSSLTSERTHIMEGCCLLSSSACNCRITLWVSTRADRSNKHDSVKHNETQWDTMIFVLCNVPQPFLFLSLFRAWTMVDKVVLSYVRHVI